MEKDEIVYAKNITLEKALELANQLATVCKQRPYFRQVDRSTAEKLLLQCRTETPHANSRPFLFRPSSRDGDFVLSILDKPNTASPFLHHLLTKDKVIAYRDTLKNYKLKVNEDFDRLFILLSTEPIRELSVERNDYFYTSDTAHIPGYGVLLIDSKIQYIIDCQISPLMNAVELAQLSQAIATCKTLTSYKSWGSDFGSQSILLGVARNPKITLLFLQASKLQAVLFLLQQPHALESVEVSMYDAQDGLAILEFALGTPNVLRSLKRLWVPGPDSTRRNQLVEAIQKANPSISCR